MKTYFMIAVLMLSGCSVAKVKDTKEPRFVDSNEVTCSPRAHHICAGHGGLCAAQSSQFLCCDSTIEAACAYKAKDKLAVWEAQPPVAKRQTASPEVKKQTKLPPGVEWPIRVTCKSSGERKVTRPFMDSLCKAHDRVCGMKSGKFLCCDKTEDEDCTYQKKQS